MSAFSVRQRMARARAQLRRFLGGEQNARQQAFWDAVTRGRQEIWDDWLREGRAELASARVDYGEAAAEGAADTGELLRSVVEELWWLRGGILSAIQKLGSRMPGIWDEEGRTTVAEWVEACARQIQGECLVPTPDYPREGTPVPLTRCEQIAMGADQLARCWVEERKDATCPAFGRWCESVVILGALETAAAIMQALADPPPEAEGEW